MLTVLRVFAVVRCDRSYPGHHWSIVSHQHDDQEERRANLVATTGQNKPSSFKFRFLTSNTMVWRKPSSFKFRFLTLTLWFGVCSSSCACPVCEEPSLSL